MTESVVDIYRLRWKADDGLHGICGQETGHGWETDELTGSKSEMVLICDWGGRHAWSSSSSQKTLLSHGPDEGATYE